MTRVQYGATGAACAALAAADTIGAHMGYPFFDLVFGHEPLSNAAHNFFISVL